MGSTSIVSLAEFDAIQEVTGRSTSPRPQSREFAFTGMIAAAPAGSPLPLRRKKNRYAADYTYYHCSRRKRGLLLREK